MPRSRPLAVASRVAAGVVGGWLFAAGVVGAGIVALAAAGMAYRDAETLMRLVGVGVLLVVFVWAFAEARVARVWAALGGGGAALLGAAWWFGRAVH